MDLKLDEGMRRILKENIRKEKDIEVKLCIEGEIKEKRIDMKKREENVVGKDSRIGIVGCEGGDDIWKLERLIKDIEGKNVEKGKLKV